jgi:hypothetical protein
VFEVIARAKSRADAALRSYVRHRPTDLSSRLAAVRALAERTAPDLFEHKDLTGFELRAFSQNGEDGVLIEILNRIGVSNRYFVEFGIESGIEGNCVALAEVLGWSGLFIEADPTSFAKLHARYSGYPIRTANDLVTAENVEEVFLTNEVPASFDVLSIDIDGNDIYVWDALSGFRPRVVIIEYNSGIAEPGPVAQPHDPDRGWDGSGGFGSSLAALDVVAERHGYRLAYTDLTGTNAFYVLNEEWDKLGVTQVRRRNQNIGLVGATRDPATPPGGWQQLAVDDTAP